MNEILSKLSSYNIFNYLLPGVLFVAITDSKTQFSLLHEEILINFFICYFIGLIISRIGSLMIEPILKKFNFVKFEEYSKFIEASRTDKKINILSEENNMYRTMCSLFFVLSIVFMVNEIAHLYPCILPYFQYILTFLLLILFLFSYRKQSNYISSRIRKEIEDK